MTKKAEKNRINQESVLGCRDKPIFDAAATSQLLVNIGRPLTATWTNDELESALNELALGFAIDRYRETNPDEPPSPAQASRLEKACQTVLKELGATGAGDEIDPAFEKGLFRVALARGRTREEAAVSKTVRAIRLLADDARLLALISARRRWGRHRKPGPAEDKAIKQLIAGLSELYFAAWGALPGITRGWDTQTPTGPFVELLCGVHEQLLERGLDTMVREPDALAQTWNRLPDEDKLKDIKSMTKTWRSAMDELK